MIQNTSRNQVFWILGSFFWILGSVFGFWGLLFDSGKVFFSSGKCLVPMSHRTELIRDITPYYYKHSVVNSNFQGIHTRKKKTKGIFNLFYERHSCH